MAKYLLFVLPVFLFACTQDPPRTTATQEPPRNAPVAAPESVTLIVRNSGQLYCGGYSVASGDLPAFAHENAQRQILIAPDDFAPYGVAVSARDALVAAGAPNVYITIRRDR